MEAKGLAFSKDLGFTTVRNLGMTGNYWEEKHAFSGATLTRKLDTAKPWVGDPKDPASMERARNVRLALAHAIDRAGLAKSIMGGLGAPAYFAYEPPVTSPMFKKGPYPQGWEYPFDIAKAKEFLKKGGQEKGFEMEVWVGPPGTTSELMTAMAGTWLAELNIKVTLDQNVYSTYRPGLVHRTTSKPFMGCGDDEKYNFPYDWARGFVMSSFSDGGYGVGMEIPWAAENYRKVAGEPDRQKRIDMNLAFTQKGIDEALCIGVASEPVGFMYNPNVIASWELLPMGNGNVSGMHNLETIVLKK
jgi:ABC-type transport system substrate-binding protein